MVATVETLPEAKPCGRPRGNLCSLSRLCGEKKWSNEFGARNLEHVDSQEETYSTAERRLPPPNINGANTYQFVGSNPVNATDPWGLAGEEGDAGGDPATPPSGGLWEGLYGAFGFQPYFGPRIVDTPSGYGWYYPPTIAPQGAPADEALWQLQPTDPNNPRTPWINPIGPNGDTLTPEDQIDLAKRAIKDADEKKELDPKTKGPARKAYPYGTKSMPRPSIPFPGAIPRDQAPGPGWEWRGQLPVGGGQENWFNPSTGESLYNDMQSTDHGPHWDYRQQGESGKWRWYPGGGMEYQK